MDHLLSREITVSTGLDYSRTKCKTKVVSANLANKQIDAYKLQTPLNGYYGAVLYFKSKKDWSFTIESQSFLLLATINS